MHAGNRARAVTPVRKHHAGGGQPCMNLTNAWGAPSACSAIVYSARAQASARARARQEYIPQKAALPVIDTVNAQAAHFAWRRDFLVAGFATTLKLLRIWVKRCSADLTRSWRKKPAVREIDLLPAATPCAR
jgi:hypothetical protein